MVSCFESKIVTFSIYLTLSPEQSQIKEVTHEEVVPPSTDKRLTNFRRKIHNPNVVKSIYGTEIELFTNPELMSLYNAKVGDPIPSEAGLDKSSGDVIIGSLAGRLWFSGENGVRCDVSGTSQFAKTLDLEREISLKNENSIPWKKEGTSKKEAEGKKEKTPLDDKDRGESERNETEKKENEKKENEENGSGEKDENDSEFTGKELKVSEGNEEKGSEGSNERSEGRGGKFAENFDMSLGVTDSDPSFENDACRYLETTLSALSKYICFPRYIAPILTQVAGHLPLEIRRNVLESFQDNADLSIGISINRAEGINSRLRSWTSPDDPIEIQSLLKSQYYLVQLFRALKQLDFVFDDGRVSPNLFRSRHAFMIQSGYADNAYDLSGPYRNFMSDLASEWWGSGETHGLPLFVPSDTQSFDTSADVSDRFSWIPNRACKSETHLQLYRFIGQLVGCMVIGNVQVEIIWPNLVWKWMIGREKIEWSDLGSISVGMVSLLKTMDSLNVDEWSREVGGYLDCFDALPELIKCPSEIERCVTTLKRKISSFASGSLGMSTSSLMSLSSSLNKSTGSLLLSLTQMDVPYALKNDIIEIICNSFIRSCEPQLNAMRDGLHSGA